MSGRVVLTPCTGKSGFSRLSAVLAISCSVKFLATKLLAPWHSLTLVHSRSRFWEGRAYCFVGRFSFERRMLPEAGAVFYRWKTIALFSERGTSDPLHRRHCGRSLSLCSQTISRRQARSPPVEPPGSNTRVCLYFICKTFNFQILLNVVAY